MKLVSFAAAGRNSYGAVVGDGIVDLGRRLGDRWPTLRSAIAANTLGRLASEAKDAAPDTALSRVTLLPPITDPEKIICAGRNYRAHAAEAGGAPPENPQVFLRLVNTLVAHNQPMVRPRISGDFDYEWRTGPRHRQAWPPYRQRRLDPRHPVQAFGLGRQELP